MGKGSKAPEPDANIGIAALRTAELGEEYLDWAKGQADIANTWAGEDRARHQEVFQPLQDQFIEEAQAFDTPEAQATAARAAVSDVQGQAAIAKDAAARDAARMGVDPRSGRAADTRTGLQLRTGLAAAGAANTARTNVQATGRQLRAAAVDLGSGGAVNPATSLGLAGNTMASGFSGAQSGNQQMGSLLQGQHNAQMDAWKANQNSSSQLWGGIGQAAGMLMFSSKKLKTDKKPIKEGSNLRQLRKMPVEDWKYKDGVADGGHHTGPYAEDFQKATGRGDGKTIPVVDAIGKTMGAVQELDRKVATLSRQLSKRKVAA